MTGSTSCQIQDIIRSLEHIAHTQEIKNNFVKKTFTSLLIKKQSYDKVFDREMIAIAVILSTK